MSTPIADFVRRYAASGTSRLHMPGHKGAPQLGCEPFDLTEIAGADSLYEASGIIAESERQTAALFGARRTLYGAEGSSQCIRAMLFLLTAGKRPRARRATVLAGRNAHKAFLSAAALLDLDVRWLYPDGGPGSICACAVSPDALARALDALPEPPDAVYLTSPDYLGGVADIARLAQVCHARGVPLAVDNAHGAYLRFLPSPLHPLGLGADICCDSAHKTLPVLTGGAYLHIAQRAPQAWDERARQAMALFGSTSPSYLTLTSLDLCGDRLSRDYPSRIAEACARVDALKGALADRGWAVCDSDPLRLTLDASARGVTGTALAERLRQGGVECEYADPDYAVMMFTPENPERDYARVLQALGACENPPCTRAPLPIPRGEAAMSIREAMFAPRESVPVERAARRICGAPTVSCPPAVPIAVCGERITEPMLALLRRYGVERVEVVREGEA